MVELKIPMKAEDETTQRLINISKEPCAREHNGDGKRCARLWYLDQIRDAEMCLPCLCYVATNEKFDECAG